MKPKTAKMTQKIHQVVAGSLTLRAHAKRAGHQISPADLEGISIVGRTPGLILGDIALKRGASTAAITNFIDRLEEKRLVERRVPSEDRRQKKVFLTSVGETLVKTLESLPGPSGSVINLHEVVDGILLLQAQAHLVGVQLSPVDLEGLHLIRLSPGRNLRSIADMRDLSPAAITGMVDQLERMRLVKRRTSGKDRRQRGLFLTPKGEELLTYLETL